MYRILRNFFWFCSGANTRLLRENDIDHNKYFAIGATIFFTALFAGISAGYAIYFVFSGSQYAFLSSCIFGAIWGLAIFNIDRFLVMSIKKENKPGREILFALPRIFLAIIIGVVIARPLELKIFEKEINEGLKQFYLEEKKIENRLINDNFRVKHANLYEKLEIKISERDSASTELKYAEELRDAECYGKLLDGRTTGKFGDGPNCKLRKKEVGVKLENHTNLVNEVLGIEKRIDSLEKFSNINKVTTDSEIDSIVQNAGFYDRNKILGQISGWSPLDWFSSSKEKNTQPNEGLAKELVQVKAVQEDTIGPNTKTEQEVVQEKVAESDTQTEQEEVAQARTTKSRFNGEEDGTVFFISMLFIFFETLPILVKLMTKRGTYDIMLEYEEDRAYFTKHHESIAHKRLIRSMALAQRDVLNKAIDDWRTEELESPDLNERYISNDE